MSDEHFYQKAAEELRLGTADQALAAKAFAKASGDEKKAHATYIELRATQLKSEVICQFGKEVAQKAVRLSRIVFWVIAAPVLLVVIIIAGIAIGDAMSESPDKALPKILGSTHPSAPVTRSQMDNPSPMSAPKANRAATPSNAGSAEQQSQLIAWSQRLQKKCSEVKTAQDASAYVKERNEFLKAWGEKLVMQSRAVRTPQEIAAYNAERNAYQKALSPFPVW